MSQDSEEVRQLPDSERLEGWKQIAAHLGCRPRTAQRWEKKGLPVRRHPVLGTVRAYKSELDTWRNTVAHQQEVDEGKPVESRLVEGTGTQSEDVGISNRRRWLPITVAAAFLSIICGVLIRNSTTGGLEPSMRPSVAVLGFRHLMGCASAPPSALSATLTEMFRVELAGSDQLRPLSGEDIARMKRELALPEVDGFSKDTLGRIHKNVGADFVLLGSYVCLGQESPAQIRLNLTLQDAHKGETITSLSELGAEETVAPMVSRAAMLVRRKIGVADPSAKEIVNMRAALPRSLDAQRRYSEGVEEFQNFNAVAARGDLVEAVRSEPNFAMAHSVLADVWAALGQEAKAKEEAKTAFDLASSVSPEEALFIEAKYREWVTEWDKAIGIYKRLCEFAPDRLEYRLRLAKAQTAVGRADDTFATLAEARKLPSQAGADPRIDLVAAETAESLGDFKGEQTAADQAIRKGEVAGTRLLVARAQLSAGWAVHNLGQPKQAIDLDENARHAFSSMGDQEGEAHALKNIADVLDDQGDHAKAQRIYEQALAIFRRIGYERGVAVALNNLGYAIEEQGKLAEAKRAFEESLKISRQLLDAANQANALNGVAAVLWRQGELTDAEKMYGEALRIHLDRHEKNRAATVLGNLAIMLQDKGSLPDARKKFDKALALLRETGDKQGQARTLSNIGELLVRQGYLVEAKTTFQDALSIGQSIQEDRQCAYAQFGLGEVLLAQGDLRGATETEERALALRVKMGEKGLVAESRMALAELALEEGNPEAAASAARDASEEFRAEREIDEEASARAILAEALAAARKPEPALAAMALSKEVAVKSEDKAVRIEVLIAIGRVCAAVDRRAQAIGSFQSALAEASNHGYGGYELKARLGLERAEFESGNPEARSRLEVLEREARTKGFGLIARQAASVLSLKPNVPKVARSQ